MELRLDRKPSENATTFGQLFVDGIFECYTLEDEIREHKIQGITCIPAGRYKVTMQSSTRFGPDTITINDVPNFTSIRIHGGNSAADTEGCPIVGDQINREKSTISGGAVRGVLKRLKDKVRAGLPDVWITIHNPKE